MFFITLLSCDVAMQESIGHEQNYYLVLAMNLDQMHNELVNHYRKVRTLKTKRSFQIQSVVGQAYKRKVENTDDTSPYQDFLRNQSHIAVEEEPLYFRSLPRKLKVYFPGPPAPPPQLKEIPYTYEIVPKVPFTLPKQKPGYVGDWILEDCKFVERKSTRNKQKSSKSMIESYRPERTTIMGGNIIERRNRFRSEVKKLATQMKEKNLSLKEIIKNKGLTKKTHNFYNSVDFFLMARTGDQQIERLLQNNPQLAFDVDDQHMTGLHWAAKEGHAHVCRILTQKFRANVQSKDCYGRTPLHLAVENKNTECIIRIFIEGGHLNSLNNNKKSVRNVAPDAYTKYLLEKLEEIKFVIKSRNFTDKQVEKENLQVSIRNTLDESSMYF